MCSIIMEDTTPILISEPLNRIYWDLLFYNIFLFLFSIFNKDIFGSDYFKILIEGMIWSYSIIFLFLIILSDLIVLSDFYYFNNFYVFTIFLMSFGIYFFNSNFYP